MSGEPGHSNHRDRLRKRFFEGGGAAPGPHEFLEMLLFQADKRRDTKPVARALIDRFGGLAAVLRAGHGELTKVKGVGDAAAAAIMVVAEAASRLAREEAMDRPVLDSWDRVLAYLRVEMAHRTTESFRILFLDTKNRLIGDEEQQTGTVNHTPLYPREVIKSALDRGASAIIMVHNHPSGDPSPSRADISMTREVREIGKGLGIAVHDHVIVARGGHSSFRSLGLL